MANPLQRPFTLPGQVICRRRDGSVRADTRGTYKSTYYPLWYSEFVSGKNNKQHDHHHAGVMSKRRFC